MRFIKLPTNERSGPRTQRLGRWGTINETGITLGKWGILKVGKRKEWLALKKTTDNSGNSRIRVFQKCEWVLCRTTSNLKEKKKNPQR